jgi:secondary thiamine-phosphate synthase enzyme
MKVFTDYLWFNTKKRQEFVRITDEIAAIVKKSGIEDGMVSSRPCHIRRLRERLGGRPHQDFRRGSSLRPPGCRKHHQTGEDNADAHLKRTIMGHQVMLPITGSKLDLGPWERVFYAGSTAGGEEVVVKVMGA